MSTTVDRQGNVYVNNVLVGWALAVVDTSRAVVDVPRAVVDIPRPSPVRCIGWEYVVSPMAVTPTDSNSRHSAQLYRTRHEAVAALLERLS